MKAIDITYSEFCFNEITTSNIYPAVILSGGLVLDAKILDFFNISSINIVSLKNKTIKIYRF